MIGLRSCAIAVTRTRVPFFRPARPLGRTLSAVLLVSAGCARVPIQPPPLPAPVPPSEPRVLSVAVLEPVSDVADLTEAVRHVVSPSGLLSVPSPTSAATSMPPSPAAVSGAGAVTVLEPVGSTGPLTAVDPPDTLEMSAPDDALTPPAAPAPDDGTPAQTGPAADATASPEPVPPNASVPATPPETGEAAGLESSLPVQDGPVQAGELEPGTAPRDTILAAWEHYCVSTDLTPEQWGIIDRTSMPESMQTQWATRCRPEK